MNLNLYEENLHHSGFSIFTGGKAISGIVHYLDLPQTGLMKAFLDDDDIQEIRIVSSNLGFGRTYQKQFRKSKAMGKL